MKVSLDNKIKTRFKLHYAKMDSSVMIDAENEKEDAYYQYLDNLVTIIDSDKGLEEKAEEEKGMRHALLDSLEIDDDTRDKYMAAFLQIFKIGKVILADYEKERLSVEV